MNSCFRLAAVLLGSILLAASAAADEWPTRPITIIVSGAADAVPRILGPAISGPLGQQVVVDRHSGAGGIIAAEYTLHRPADGYTVLMVTAASNASSITHVVPYNVLHDFAPVILAASSPFILVSNSSLPVRSIPQLIALAKKHPGELNYSATSTGSSSDLVAELFKKDAHINIVHVGYKSMGAALLDVLGGHVELCSSVGPNAIAQIKAHKVRALAVSTAKRSPLLPDVPSYVEAGFPNIVLPAWYGFVMRKGAPPEVVHRLSALLDKALQQPDVRKKLQMNDLDPVGDTPEQFGAFMKTNYQRWQAAADAADMEKKRPHHS